MSIKVPEKEKMSHVITVKFKIAEKKAILTASTKAHMGQSTYIRKLVLEALEKKK